MDAKCILKIAKTYIKSLKLPKLYILEKIILKVFSFLFTNYIKNVIINY